MSRSPSFAPRGKHQRAIPAVPPSSDEALVHGGPAHHPSIGLVDLVNTEINPISR
jgi:hypothetical protein